MTDYTRRTHIVRVSLDATAPALGAQPSEFADIEVVDAIAFRTDNDEEVILDMTVSNAAPYIVDDTGGGHDKQPDADATQRTNMKRITSKDDPTQQLDVECMGVMAFRGQNDEEWILDMQATTGDGPSIFDQTDNTGDSTATRRMHSEKLADPFIKKGDPDPTSYLTSQRCDAVAFRKVNSDEVIFSCPSNDDPNGSDPRASTFVWSPTGYDPSDDSDAAVVPPSLADSGDAHNYVCAVKDASGFMTGDAKINMGPFWWIRKISDEGGYLWLHLVSNGALPTISLSKNGSKIDPLAEVTVTNVTAIADGTTTKQTVTTTVIVGEQSTKTQVVSTIPNATETWYCWAPRWQSIGPLTLQEALDNRDSGNVAQTEIIGAGSETWTYQSTDRFSIGEMLRVPQYPCPAWYVEQYAGADGVPYQSYYPAGVPFGPYVRQDGYWNPFFPTGADAHAYADFMNSGAPVGDGNFFLEFPLSVDFISRVSNRYERYVLIKTGTGSTVTADITLAPDPNNSHSTGGGFGAEIWSVWSGGYMADLKTPLDIEKLLFNGMNADETTNSNPNPDKSPLRFNSSGSPFQSTAGDFGATGVASGKYTIKVTRDTDTTNRVIPPPDPITGIVASGTVMLWVDVALKP
jgi:hypothetical protein